MVVIIIDNCLHFSKLLKETAINYLKTKLKCLIISDYVCIKSWVNSITCEHFTYCLLLNVKGKL